MKIEITVRDTNPEGNRIDKLLQEQIILRGLQIDYAGIIDVARKED